MPWNSECFPLAMTAVVTEVAAVEIKGATYTALRPAPWLAELNARVSDPAVPARTYEPVPMDPPISTG